MKKLLPVIIPMAVFVSCIAIRPTERIEFTSPDLYPEGIAYDQTSDKYFISSMRSGTISQVDPMGNINTFYSDSNLKSSYGLKVSPDGKSLYACVGDANHSKFQTPDTKKKMARLVVFDIASKQKVKDIDLSQLIPGNHFPNDIAFDGRGNAYVTDSYANAIYKITGDGTPSVFSKSPLFKTEGVGLNGIVYHTGGFFLVDNSNTGAIYKVDISNPANVSKVKIDQYFLGGDGLVLEATDKLAIVVNGGNDKIFRLSTEDNWMSAKMVATTLIADRFTYPATATQKGTDLWIMNAKTNELSDSNAAPSKIFAIQKAVLKPIPKTK